MNWFELSFTDQKTKRSTESEVMTREGGTKSNFSPFLMFFKATKPLSPTSTFSLTIFCGGRPESESHLWSAEEFSSESMSHPHGTVIWVGVVLVAVSFSVETEQWSTWRSPCLLREKFVKKVWESGLWLLWRWGNVGSSVVWKILEASTMTRSLYRERERNLICLDAEEKREIYKKIVKWYGWLTVIKRRSFGDKMVSYKWNNLV